MLVSQATIEPDPPLGPPADANADRDSRTALAERYQRIRDFSLTLASPLSAEDCGLQSMPDASPTRWHMAHTTWFFETFVLKSLANFVPFDAAFERLFNSYYNAIGAQYPRERRGLLSRPGLNEILKYRQEVDQRLLRALTTGTLPAAACGRIELGLQHEQQHQELMLTDIKHAFWCNPLFPAYSQPTLASQSGVAFQSSFVFQSRGVSAGLNSSATPLSDRAPKPDSSAMRIRDRFAHFDARLGEAGFAGSGFAFDNETPRHKSYLHAYELATHCVTNGEFREFIDEGGYERPEWWLSLGWQQVQLQQWQAPLYWVLRDGDWYEFSLAGLVPLQLDGPVCHVSYFEADAFARWAGKRLPTEFEWEGASAWGSGEHFADRLMARGEAFHPRPEAVPAVAIPASGHQPLSQLFGNVWEWTSSPYAAYPGFTASPGALGEYNGKFMCNQFVLRGGSCATSADHVRSSYRNFFPPEARWQFSGFRLAASCE